MISVDVDFNNTLDVLHAVESIAQNQRKWGLFRKMARFLFHSWWGETFARSGARRGHPAWKPLNERYAIWKAKQGKSKAILRYYGHLQASPNILGESKTTLQWGTNIPYAQYHQAPTKPGRPPKREIIFVTRKDESEIESFVRDFIDNVLRKK